MLAVTTKKGYATQWSAAIAINNQCLDLNPLDLSSFPDGIDEDIDQLVSFLPKGSFITHMTPREKGTVMEDDVPAVEVRSFDSINAPILDIKVTTSQLKVLVARNIAELDSSSGNDSGLYYRYDHFVIQ